MQLRKSDLSWHVAGEEIVILDLNGSVYLKLNGSGRFLWEQLNESTDEESLVTSLVEKYGIDDDRARSDVAAFVADLRQRKLLTD